MPIRGYLIMVILAASVFVPGWTNLLFLFPFVGLCLI